MFPVTFHVRPLCHHGNQRAQVHGRLSQMATALKKAEKLLGKVAPQNAMFDQLPRERNFRSSKPVSTEVLRN